MHINKALYIHILHPIPSNYAVVLVLFVYALDAIFLILF